MKTGRNEPCPCGSGKKYKQCCANKKTNREWLGVVMWIALLALVGGGLLAALVEGPPEVRDRVWSEEHGHYHDAPAEGDRVWSEEHGHYHDAPEE